MTFLNALMMSAFFIAVYAPCTSEGARQGLFRNEARRTTDSLLARSEMDWRVESPVARDTWPFEKVTEPSRFSRQCLIGELIQFALFPLQGPYQETDRSFHDVPHSANKILNLFGCITFIIEDAIQRVKLIDIVDLRTPAYDGITIPS